MQFSNSYVVLHEESDVCDCSFFCWYIFIYPNHHFKNLSKLQLNKICFSVGVVLIHYMTGAVAGDSWNHAKTCQFYFSRVVSQPVPSWSHAGTSVKHCQSCNKDRSKGPNLAKIAVPVKYIHGK